MPGKRKTLGIVLGFLKFRAVLSAPHWKQTAHAQTDRRTAFMSCRTGRANLFTNVVLCCSAVQYKLISFFFLFFFPCSLFVWRTFCRSCKAVNWCGTPRSGARRSSLSPSTPVTVWKREDHPCFRTERNTSTNKIPHVAFKCVQSVSYTVCECTMGLDCLTVLV